MLNLSLPLQAQIFLSQRLNLKFQDLYLALPFLKCKLKIDHLIIFIQPFLQYLNLLLQSADPSLQFFLVADHLFSEVDREFNLVLADLDADDYLINARNGDFSTVCGFLEEFIDTFGVGEEQLDSLRNGVLTKHGPKYFLIFFGFDFDHQCLACHRALHGEIMKGFDEFRHFWFDFLHLSRTSMKNNVRIDDTKYEVQIRVIRGNKSISIIGGNFVKVLEGSNQYLLRNIAVGIKLLQNREKYITQIKVLSLSFKYLSLFFLILITTYPQLAQPRSWQSKIAFGSDVKANQGHLAIFQKMDLFQSSAKWQQIISKVGLGGFSRDCFYIFVALPDSLVYNHLNTTPRYFEFYSERPTILILPTSYAKKRLKGPANLGPSSLRNLRQPRNTRKPTQAYPQRWLIVPSI